MPRNSVWVVFVSLLCLALEHNQVSSRPSSADDDFSPVPIETTPTKNLRIPQKQSHAASPHSPTKYGLQKSDEEVERLLVRISDQFQTIEDLRLEMKEQNEAFEQERKAERSACRLALEDKETAWIEKTGITIKKDRHHDTIQKGKKQPSKSADDMIEGGEVDSSSYHYGYGDDDDDFDDQEKEPETSFSEELYELRVKMSAKEEAWATALRNTEELLDDETEKLRDCETKCKHILT